MSVQPYLFFEGRCEEALAFYKQAAGAEVTSLMRFSDAPPPPAGSGQDQGCVPQPNPEKVMHCSFRIGDTELLGSDGMSSGKTNFQGFGLALGAKDKAEAKRLFDALGTGGQVRQPLIETFFSPAFGMVADKFGITWMIVTAQ